MIDNYTKILRTENLTSAHVLKTFLESHEIPVIIEHENLSSLKYTLPTNDTMIDVYVKNDFVKQSLALINEIQNYSSNKKIRCNNCGTDNDENFSLCWNCNYDLINSIPYNSINLDDEKKKTNSKNSIYSLILLVVAIFFGVMIYRYYHPQYDTEGKYYLKTAYDYYVNKNFASALEFSTKAIETNPRVLQGYYIRANMQIALNDYKSSIETFSIIIKMNANESEAYYGRGFSFWQMGEYDKGIEDVEKSILIKNNNVKSYEMLANIYLKKKDYNNALSNFLYCLKLNSNDNVIYYDIACIYSILDDKENALLYLEKSISLGFNDKHHIQNDGDLNNIKKTKKFIELIKKLK